MLVILTSDGTSRPYTSLFMVHVYLLLLILTCSNVSQFITLTSLDFSFYPNPHN